MRRTTTRSPRLAVAALLVPVLLVSCGPTAGSTLDPVNAAPGTQILFLQGGCTVPINPTVYFSGHLVDWPGT